jgi:predicted enzyme related to lactoylglutathione lyase
MLNFNNILVFSENPSALAAFYEKVFQKEPEWKESDYSGWQVGASFITVGPHDKVVGKSQNPERIMINFETDDVKGEFARIKELGAEIVAEPYQMEGMGENDWIATLADPDGNYFQLMTPMKPE